MENEENEENTGVDRARTNFRLLWDSLVMSDPEEPDDMDEMLESRLEGQDFTTTFDRTLACAHEYLGAQMEQLSGRTVYDEGCVTWLPIMLELGVMLVPRQTLPLTVFYPPTVLMLRGIIFKDKTFGVLGFRQLDPDAESEPEQFGTTAEIFQYQDRSELAGFRIKARGRQRFKLLEKRGDTPGILIGKVLILPEITLPSPLHAGRVTTLDRHRCNKAQKKKIARHDAAVYPWPAWVYRQYDAEHLAQRVTEEIKGMRLESDQPLPTDPNDLSYWVLQYMSIEDSHRMDMLKFNTSIERLQYALNLLAMCHQIFCYSCQNLLATKNEIFSMSQEGPQGTYCNPGGHVHEILTVYRAQGLKLEDDPPSLEYTWFPGYGWTIATCKTCYRHTGWLFTAMSADLKPTTFWGLSRRQVRINQPTYSDSNSSTD